MNELLIYINAANIHHELSMNETLTEEEQDIEYGYFWDSVNEIARILVKITNGKIDEFTAKRMAAHKRNEIEQIIYKNAI